MPKLSHPTCCTAAFSLLLLCCLPACDQGAEDQGLPLLGTHWQLTKIGSVAIDAEENGRAPFMILSPEESHVNGFAGCNNFFGTYQLDGSLLTFGAIGSTKMACPELQAEDTLLKVLGKTDTYKISGNSLLLMGEGRTLALFDALPQQ